MFDIAFSELLVIAVVALIVIGPEKLPKVARTVGLLLGRLQRYVADVKSDIDRELQLQELQKLQQDIRQGAQRIHSDTAHLQAELDAAASAINQAQQDIVHAVANPPSASTPVTGVEMPAPPDSSKPQ